MRLKWFFLLFWTVFWVLTVDRQAILLSTRQQSLEICVLQTLTMFGAQPLSWECVVSWPSSIIVADCASAGWGAQEGNWGSLIHWMQLKDTTGNTAFAWFTMCYFVTKCVFMNCFCERECGWLLSISWRELVVSILVSYHSAQKNEVYIDTLPWKFKPQECCSSELGIS
jgi:hypothetical protein